MRPGLPPVFRAAHLQLVRRRDEAERAGPAAGPWECAPQRWWATVLRGRAALCRGSGWSTRWGCVDLAGLITAAKELTRNADIRATEDEEQMTQLLALLLLKSYATSWRKQSQFSSNKRSTCTSVNDFSDFFRNPLYPSPKCRTSFFTRVKMKA